MKSLRIAASASIVTAVATIVPISRPAVATPGVRSESFRFYMSEDRNYALGVYRTGSHYRFLNLEFAPDGPPSRAFCFSGKKVRPGTYRGVIGHPGNVSSDNLVPGWVRVRGIEKGVRVRIVDWGKPQRYSRVSEATIQDRGRAAGSSMVALKGMLYGPC